MIEDDHEFCQDKAPNRSKRVPLLRQLRNIEQQCDPLEIHIVLLYADSLDNLVQDVQCHLHSRWEKNPRSKITKLWWDNFVPMGFFVVAATGLSVLVIVLASECHTWELDAVFSYLSQGVFPYQYGLNSNSVLLSASGCEMHSNPVLLELIGSLRHETHHWFRIRNHTFLYSSFFFRHTWF